MALATVPGYPRIGRKRELKRALEGYWAGKLTEADLLTAAADLRRSAWQTQRDAGLDILPINDFSLYDHCPSTPPVSSARYRRDTDGTATRSISIPSLRWLAAAPAAGMRVPWK